ncbi:MAG: virB8 family protein [Cellvibrionaceae bacterium]
MENKKSGEIIRKKDEKKSYQKANDWDEDLVESAKRETKTYKIIAAIAVLLAVPACLRLAFIPNTQPAFPVMIMMDKVTGDMEIMETSGEKIIAHNQELLDKHWAKKYIVHRESYYYSLLQYDYDMTLAMSSDQVALDYSQAFSGETPKDKKYGDRYEEKIIVHSVVLPPNSKGKVVVRYDKQLIQKDSRSIESTLTYVATFGFEYRPALTGEVRQLIENPLGFKVTAFRNDLEIITNGTRS